MPSDWISIQKMLPTHIYTVVIWVTGGPLHTIYRISTVRGEVSEVGSSTNDANDGYRLSNFVRQRGT